MLNREDKADISSEEISYSEENELNGAGLGNEAASWSGLAISGFVLGVIGFLVPFASLIAIVLSSVGLGVTKNPNKLGRTLAGWGLALGIISSAVGAYIGVANNLEGAKNEAEILEVQAEMAEQDALAAAKLAEVAEAAEQAALDECTSISTLISDIDQRIADPTSVPNWRLAQLANDGRSLAEHRDEQYRLFAMKCL